MASPTLFFAIVLLIQGVSSTTFTFTNNCPYTVWPGAISGASSPLLPSTGFELQQGASQSLQAPSQWSGRMWARYQCSTDSSGRFSCESGDCGTGQIACGSSGGAPPTTLVEFTLQGSGGQDFYDISNVDGFNVPVSVAPQGGGPPGSCSSTACAANIDGECPQELQYTSPSNGAVIGCKSACLAFNTDQYCCRGAFGSPSTCKPTNYSQFFKNACPQAYSYAYDDSSSTFTCTGANYLITYCPN
ncbi:thaumatin-like protein 1 [Ananas comosus]|uniref:Thaumatin-like protein 1 n=1 Tax=Ananas comosus TaxID=4615 RepID=A0A6P5ERW1_ANACO|nr:thaumatin-like protein 1 [Ananas comosus]